MTISREANTDVLTLPKSNRGQVLQVVRWAGKRQAVTASAVSQTIALPADVEIFEMLAVEDVFIKFGSADPVVADSTITNDGSRLFLKGVQQVPVPIDASTGKPYAFMGVIRKSTDGVFQLEVGGNSLTAFPALPGPPPTDPDFPNNVLLLDFAGADAATDITDLAVHEHVETFSNQAQVDTALQFLGKNSLLLDGTADYISYLDNSDWDFGTDDFTIECGFRTTDDTIIQAMISNVDTTGLTGFFVRFDGVANNLNFGWGNTVLSSQSWDPAVNTFYHVAVSRSGTDLRLFIDGVQIGSTVTDSTDMTGATKKLFLGTLRDDPIIQEVKGSIGAVRLTKGIARYTANFTELTSFYLPGDLPPNPEFSNVVLLLDFAGADAATDITDLSNTPHTETFRGDAQVDTALQFAGGNTLLLDGIVDMITYPDSDDWDFGTGDFCIEFGFRRTTTANIVPISNHLTPTTGWAVQFSTVAPNKLRFLKGDTILIDPDWAEGATNTFYHIVVSRKGTDLRVFIDGILRATVTDSTDFTAGTELLHIGGLNLTTQLLNGSIGALRITKGEAVYTAKFNPPRVFYPTS